MHVIDEFCVNRATRFAAVSSGGFAQHYRLWRHSVEFNNLVKVAFSLLPHVASK
jgi:hypothetical protein